MRSPQPRHVLGSSAVAGAQPFSLLAVILNRKNRGLSARLALKLFVAFNGMVVNT